MKKLIFATLIATFSLAAHARPSSWTMTCQEARQLVRNHGAVVMNYGYHEAAGYLYERFVAHGGYCWSGDQPRAAWVPTRDARSCMVGYVCEPYSGR
jgi:hypothetical protein